MTNKEAIKFLQQLHPNGGHCWLDEQRIEAIGMAIKALQKEPVSEIDFEQELYKYFGQVKDFTLGMRIAKRFYEIGRNHQEPVSEDLEEAAQRYNEDMSWCWEAPRYPHLEAFKAGALWQKKQMMAKAVDATVHSDAGGYPYIPQMELYDYDKDIPLAKEGDKYKLILIKED